MYCQYKCDNCDEWHALANIPTRHLRAAQLSFYIAPPPPFTGVQWLLIIAAELEKRSRHGH